LVNDEKNQNCVDRDVRDQEALSAVAFFNKFRNDIVGCFTRFEVRKIFGCGVRVQLTDRIIAEVQNGQIFPNEFEEDDDFDFVETEVHNFQMRRFVEAFEMKSLKLIVGEIEFFQLLEIPKTPVDVSDKVVG
jgi:hypothetical protein